MEPLQKVTIQYDAAEDRIKLTGLLHNENVVNIWLTQRFLGLLVKQMIDWLDKNKQSDAKDESFMHIMHEFAQDAAISSQKPENPVVAPAKAHSMLPKAFDFSSTKSAIVIVFRENIEIPNAESYQFTLEEVVLRRWLQGLYSVYETAGWTKDIWPEWLRNTAKQNDAQITILKH